MKAVEIVTFGIVVLAILVFFIVTKSAAALSERRRRRRELTEPWRVEEDEIGRTTVVQLVRPGEDPIYVGDPVPHNLSHLEYEDKVSELWTEAEDMAMFKNLRLQRALKK